MKSIFPMLVSMCVFSAIAQQNLSYHQGCEPITLSDNRILFPQNGVGVFAIDTGSSASIVFGEQPGNKVNKLLNNNLFSGMKSFVEKIPSVDACALMPLVGRIGYDFFRKSGQAFQLDFDAGTFCMISDDVPNQLEKYQQIDALFRNDGIYITVKLRWKAYQLKFDTGYSGTVSMTTKDAARFIKEACKQYQTEEGDYAVYLNKWITIGDNYYSSAVEVSDTDDSKIGIGFLKGFNWIIDFRAHKIYLKKNNIGLDAQNQFPPDYAAAVRDGQLKIVSKRANATRFQLGDVIKSVNGTAVTPANVCEIAIFLRAPNGWEINQIQTIAGE